MTDMWKTMSGLSLPMDAMAKLQGDYISQATAIMTPPIIANGKVANSSAAASVAQASAA